MGDEKGVLSGITATSDLAVGAPIPTYTCPRCGVGHNGMGHSWMIQNNEKGYRAEFCAGDIADAAVAILKERGVPVTITKLSTAGGGR